MIGPRVGTVYEYWKVRWSESNAHHHHNIGLNISLFVCRSIIQFTEKSLLVDLPKPASYSRAMNSTRHRHRHRQEEDSEYVVGLINVIIRRMLHGGAGAMGAVKINTLTLTVKGLSH